MKTATGATSRQSGTKAPADGRYTGKVDGHPAVFAVAGDVVQATWYRPPSRGEFSVQSNAWDVEKGRFEARVGGEVVRCSINASTRS